MVLLFLYTPLSSPNTITRQSSLLILPNHTIQIPQQQHPAWTTRINYASIVAI